jgi:hypothetical protein
MNTTDRLAYWKAQFPLRKLETQADVTSAINIRDRWVTQHPLRAAIIGWPAKEREYFDAIGDLIQDAVDEGLCKGM